MAWASSLRCFRRAFGLGLRGAWRVGYDVGVVALAAKGDLSGKIKEWV